MEEDNPKIPASLTLGFVCNAYSKDCLNTQQSNCFQDMSKQWLYSTHQKWHVVAALGAATRILSTRRATQATLEVVTKESGT